MDKEKELLKILKTIYLQTKGIYLVNLENEVYETMYTRDEFINIIPERGSLIELYKAFFLANRYSENIRSDSYDIFATKDLFLKRNYRGEIEINIDGDLNKYDYHVVCVSEKNSVFIFAENTKSVEADIMEKEKINAIQEDYLFSMVIDLKKDLCLNSVITEISSERQNYLELKYSNWRLKISNMFMEEDRETFLQISSPEYIIEKLTEEKQFKYDIQMMNMQGEFIWVRLMFRRMKIFDEANQIFMYSVQDINDDMTRILKQTNIIAAVQKKNEQLTDINKAKTMFISNMSHEIRTPINAILGLDEMILRESREDNILEYANNIKSAGSMLLSVINDILDFSKIESGKMRIVPVEYSVESMINDICNIIKIKVQQKELNFKVDIAENIPKNVIGDEVRIKQIIINILTNAVKYTEKGGVHLAMRCEKIYEDEVELEVKVSDTGIGIKEEDIPMLFSDFERLDVVRNRNIEGTGLGISIVTRLLHQMGSRLDVKSKYGKGSTFSFKLRQKVVSWDNIGDYEKIRENHIRDFNNNPIIVSDSSRILAVDDNSVNIQVIECLLKRTRIKVDSVQSGMECLEKIKEQKYDIILLDYNMPVMNGEKTLKKIRSMGGEYENLPVIVLTADTTNDARERYMGMGFTNYIEKPIDGELLEKTIAHYIMK